MRGCARNGDTCGGSIIATATKTFVNGRKVARLGDPITAHGPGVHASAHIASASPNVFAEGIAVARQGDVATCGHTISTFSPNTTVN